MKFTLLFAVFFTAIFSFGQTPVDTTEAINIGGIRQFISLQGNDNTLPLLLFLHGGPGGSVMGYSKKFTNHLREHFVVIQWDQRQTGKTLELNTSPTPLSFGLFQQDTHELIEVLLNRFHKEKLYLAAHSWGTALGFHIAAKYPQLLYAYIPIGPMINQLESERIALSSMKEKALVQGNQKETEELANIHIPFENGEQLYYHRKWLLDLAGRRNNLSKDYVDNWAATWLFVFNEASRENLMLTLPSVDCPVYFFAGRSDLQTNSGIAEQYYTMLKAPKKGFYWFETGHSIPSAQPAQMQEIIIEKILPETYTP